jgi:hypothetical protein
MGALIRSPWRWIRGASEHRRKTAAAADAEPRAGEHCTEMLTDSQRDPEVFLAALTSHDGIAAESGPQ